MDIVSCIGVVPLGDCLIDHGWLTNSPDPEAKDKVCDDELYDKSVGRWLSSACIVCLWVPSLRRPLRCKRCAGAPSQQEDRAKYLVTGWYSCDHKHHVNRIVPSHLCFRADAVSITHLSLRVPDSIFAGDL